MDRSGFAKAYTDPTTASPEALLTTLLIIVALIIVFIFLYKKYVYYKKQKIFLEELETLDLGSVESDTLTKLVKRYALNEPVAILYSLRLFDELAEKEMARVLGSPLSSDSKTKYVDMLYRIRQKTYFPEVAQILDVEENHENEAPVENPEKPVSTPS